MSAPLPETVHDLGIRILQLIAREKGIACDVLPVGTSGDAILATARSRGSKLLGISVGVVESIPGALELWRGLAGRLPLETSLAFGGQAFRSNSAPKVDEALPVLRTLDDFLGWILPFQPEPPSQSAIQLSQRRRVGRAATR